MHNTKCNHYVDIIYVITKLYIYMYRPIVLPETGLWCKKGWVPLLKSIVMTFSKSSKIKVFN